MDQTIRTLERRAAQIRLLALRGIYRAGSGHPGGSLSCADLLAALYFYCMSVDPAHPQWEDRDRLVLSKGHAAPAYYAALALRGYFSGGEMDRLRQLGAMLQGHPSAKTPGVDLSSGSLGQGLSAANGMALAGRLDGRPYRVYCICGDGEMQEGQIWEAAMTAAHHRLSRVTLLIDNNGLQIDGAVREVMNDQPIAARLSAFGWNTLEIDGHDMAEILAADRAANAQRERPTAIVCKTVKGKGVSFMEGRAQWHGAAPDEEQYRRAAAELTAQMREGTRP